MSQPFEDRSPEAPEPPQLALGERPRSELQRAVQMRAQESMERQRLRASKRPNPIRRVAGFALALIPVALLFLAIDGLLRVFHQMNALYNSPEANPVPAVPSAPEVDVSEPQPGVVLLQPLLPPPPEPRKSEPAPSR
jgi:hypothetical protein